MTLLKTEWAILGETIRVAASLRKKLEENYNLPILPPRNPDLTVPPLNLPAHHELLRPLMKMQISDSIRKEVLQCLDYRVTLLQREYTTSYKRACLDCVQGSNYDLAPVHAVYQALAHRHYLPMIQSYVSFIVEEAAKYQSTVVSTSKRPFNPEYGPILEKYFEYNAYPSAKHQEILADKSFMTRRQIEVWFQNHRNRAKKDDKIIRRNATDLPLRLALNTLQGRFEPTLLDRSPSPSNEEYTSENTDEEVEDTPQFTSCIDYFANFRPQHAFPSIYPPVRDPFSAANSAIKFAPPIWIRKPASSAPAHVGGFPVDMDELARLFHAKLNIFDGTTKRGSSLRTFKAHTPWYAATVTIPYRAPLSACVRAPSRHSSTNFPTLNTLSSHLIVGSRLTTTADAFLSPLRQETMNTRKISPLPRRIPAGQSNAIFAPLPSQSISRLPSFSSDYASRSRSSSSSSSSRTPEPTTPPQLPTWNIPAIQDADQVHQSPDNSDFRSLFGDDPDILSMTSFGSLSIPQSVNLVVNKHPSVPDFSSLMSFAVPSHIQAKS